MSGIEHVRARCSAAQQSRKQLFGDGPAGSNTTNSSGRRVITIALALFSTTVVTAGLGFAFWALAAHLTTTEVVGRASAAISAMQLIGTFGTLGLHILLTAELPRRDDADVKGLVVTSLGVAGGLAFAIAAGYAVVNHLVTKTGEWIYATPSGIALFGVGTALTTVTVVLDGALVGVQQAARQTSRNLVFALVKLIALPVAAFAVGLSTHVVFSVWLLGNLVSLLTLGLRARAPQEWLKTMPSIRGFFPLWRAGASYHWINVGTHAPVLIMPIMVAAQLGAHANAGFYAALLLVSVVWIIPSHLATAMLTLDRGNAVHFGRGLSTALRLSMAVSVVAAAGAPALAGPVLAIFGPGYEEARHCLIALATCTFAIAIKMIYIPVRRAQGALGKAALAVALGTAVELGAAELGLKLGGVTGVGIGYGAAVLLEALCFWPTVRKARKSSGARAVAEIPDLNRSVVRSWPVRSLGLVVAGWVIAAIALPFANAGMVAISEQTAAVEQRGIVLPTWKTHGYAGTAATQATSDIAGLGAGWIQLTPTWKMATLTSSEIDVAWSVTDADLLAAIDLARSKGLKVLLKPHVDPQDGTNRWDIHPSDRAAWFKSYQAMMAHYATIAQRNGVEEFSVGCELATMSGPADHSAWLTVITAIKAIYSGPLLYAATIVEYPNVSFWAQLNFVGIDAYFPLSTEPTTDLTVLEEAWIPIRDQLSTFAVTVGRPILFTEVGYPSLAGAAVEPWNNQYSSTPSQLEQAVAYQALLATFNGQPWWAGAFWWSWWTDYGVYGPLDHAIGGKLADSVLRSWWDSHPLVGPRLCSPPSNPRSDSDAAGRTR